MTFIEIAEKVSEEKHGIYFKSPRWNNERVVLLFDTDTIGLISIDYSLNEGLIGNTFDETEFGNRSGRFLNQQDELLQDDFERATFDEAKSLVDEYEKKWK